MIEEASVDRAPVDAVAMLPCPCCGGDVAIDDPDAHERGVGYRIECEPCYLSMWAFAGEKPAALIARWNNRFHRPMKCSDCEWVFDEYKIGDPCPCGCGSLVAT